MLITEDDPVVSCLLVDLLAQWGYTVDAVADSRGRAIAVESRRSPVGHSRLDASGSRWPRHLPRRRAREHQAYVYILILTAKTAKAELIAALEAGADDYLVKPFDAYELKARLMAGRRILDLQDRLQNLVMALEHQSLHDPLTGLWNRGAVMQNLDQQMSRTRREQMPVSVLLIDLDHFKAINDTYGHAAGDVVLREAARRMQSSLRPYDGIGRYGGETFIVLPGCDAATTTPWAIGCATRLAIRPCSSAICAFRSHCRAASQPWMPKWRDRVPCFSADRRRTAPNAKAEIALSPMPPQICFSAIIRIETL